MYTFVKKNTLNTKNVMRIKAFSNLSKYLGYFFIFFKCVQKFFLINCILFTKDYVGLMLALHGYIDNKPAK